MKYYVKYRECNITGWHIKGFFFKKSALKFINFLKEKNYDDIEFLINGEFFEYF